MTSQSINQTKWKIRKNSNITTHWKMRWALRSLLYAKRLIFCYANYFQIWFPKSITQIHMSQSPMEWIFQQFGDAKSAPNAYIEAKRRKQWTKRHSKCWYLLIYKQKMNILSDFWTKNVAANTRLCFYTNEKWTFWWNFDQFWTPNVHFEHIYIRDSTFLAFLSHTYGRNPQWAIERILNNALLRNAKIMNTAAMTTLQLRAPKWNEEMKYLYKF